MGNSKKRKKKKKVGYNSLGMIAIALVVLVLLGGLMLESNDLKMETDEYAEEVAREKLGLVKDNETVFKKQQ